MPVNRLYNIQGGLMLNLTKKNQELCFVLMFIASFLIVLFTNDILATTTLWAGSGSANAITQFSTFYNKWFPIIVIVALACYYFFKDDRAKGYAKTVAIGSIIIRLLATESFRKIFIATIEAIPGWFK